MHYKQKDDLKQVVVGAVRKERHAREPRVLPDLKFPLFDEHFELVLS